MDVYQIIGATTGLVILITFVGAATGLAWRFVRRVGRFLDQWEGPPSIPDRIDVIEKEVDAIQKEVNGR